MLRLSLLGVLLTFIASVFLIFISNSSQVVFATSFGCINGGGEQSDWLVSKVLVHQCRVEQKHNIEPLIVMKLYIYIYM